MEMVGAVLSGMSKLCKQTKRDKYLQDIFVQFKQKLEYFESVKDAEENEKINQLFQGNMPRRESKPWLERATKTVVDVKEVLEYEDKRSIEKLTKLFQEIDDLIQRSSEHGLVIDSQRQLTKRKPSWKSQGGTYGPEKSDTTIWQRNARTRDKPTVVPKRSSGWENMGNQYHKKPIKEQVIQPQLINLLKNEVGSKLELKPLQKREAQRVPDETEYEITPLSGRETSPMHGTRFENIPALTESSVNKQQPSRRYVKVYKQGISFCKSVDLAEFNNYNDFIDEVDQLFEAGAESKDRTRNWLIVHFDFEGGMVPVGYIPWGEFCDIAHDIYILRKVEKGMNLGILKLKGVEILPAAGNLFSSQEAENVESGATETLGFSFGNVRGEIETVTSDTEEDQLNSQLRTVIRKSVEPGLTKPKVMHTVSIEDESSSNINAVEVEDHRFNPRCEGLAGPIRAQISDNHTMIKILGWIREDTGRSMGIYGIGGIGKTTVLKELFNHREIKVMFDSIVWITVSRYSSLRKMHNQIVEQMVGSSVGNDINLGSVGSALRCKKTLFLLDDVWDWIDLKALGIPDLGQENGCRLVLTTRSLDVCHAMKTETQVEMVLLSSGEAWELFHHQVGGIIHSLDIEPYARAIVAECGGLPLTIVVTGRALRKENDVLEWKLALRKLLFPGTLGTEGSEAVLQRLKFSYDRLEARDVKDCFLYCALLPENEISISKLITYFIDQNLIAGNLVYAVQKGRNIINSLLEASLLESTADHSSVIMHELIQDLASAIMSPEAEGCQFLVRTDLRLMQEDGSRKMDEFLIAENHQLLLGAGVGLKEPPLQEFWEKARMIFLMDNDLISLLERPSCLTLFSLFLQRNNRLRAIPMSFFDSMPVLEVLDLSKTRIKCLPQSFFKLQRLKVLLLRNCECFSILPPEIEALKALQLLDLRGTEIYQLPVEIGNLDSLRHLCVSFYGTSDSSECANLPSEMVSCDVISRLVHLNELTIDVHLGDLRWYKSIESIMLDVISLKELTALRFYFPEVELLEQFVKHSRSWNGKGLTKFNFVVGHTVKRIVARVPEDVELEYNQQEQCLRFVNGETQPSAVLEIVSRTTAFYLDHHLRLKHLSEFGLDNFNALRFCILRECHNIHTLVDCSVAENCAFPLLECLSVHYLWNLKSILVGSMQPGSFSRLKSLSLHTCPNLTFVLRSSMLKNFSSLESLVVEDCEAVTEVVSKDKATSSSDFGLEKLKKLKLHYLPNLVSVWKGSWPSIEQVSFYDCPKLKTLQMSLNVTNSIKEIKAENVWWKKLEWEETSLFVQLQSCFTEALYEEL